MSSKKHIRYRVLLDEGLPPKEKLPITNNLHNLKHIKHDLKKAQSRDSVVYSLATKEQYLVVVFNAKHFRPLIQETKSSIISLSARMTNKQIDLKLCKVLNNLKPSEQKGCLISINNEGIVVERQIHE